MSDLNAAPENYSGPESNPVYEDTSTMESFDDIGDDTYNEVYQQGTTATMDDDEEDNDPTPVYKREKKEAKKSDDLKILDTITEEPSEEAETTEDAKDETETKEAKAEKEPKKDEEKTEEKPKITGKKVYVKMGEDTFAIDSQATIPHKVNGKIENIPVQELLNNYSGKVGYDQKFNELNLKEQGMRKELERVTQREHGLNAKVKEVMEIINNKDADPYEALYKLVDMAGGDRYDFYERSLKSRLTEFWELSQMSEIERKAYLLEKKNEYLQQQTEKRKQSDEQINKVKTYKSQVDALRKSYGVSEAQYVDALEELRSMGHEDKDLDEQTIVEWAAITPHKSTVEELLSPYTDQISDSVYGEVVYKLSTLLREGKETNQSIQKQLQDVYGLPTEVKELSQKLSPVGRPKQSPQQKAPTKKKY